MKHFTR